MFLFSCRSPCSNGWLVVVARYDSFIPFPSPLTSFGNLSSPAVMRPLVRYTLFYLMKMTRNSLAHLKKTAWKTHICRTYRLIFQLCLCTRFWCARGVGNPKAHCFQIINIHGIYQRKVIIKLTINFTCDMFLFAKKINTFQRHFE